MNMRTKLPVSLLLLTAPLAAFAQPSSPHILSFIGGAAGGAVGGLLGALLACWLCNRHRSKNDSSLNRR
jgi:hypothetical protein